MQGYVNELKQEGRVLLHLLLSSRYTSFLTNDCKFYGVGGFSLVVRYGCFWLILAQLLITLRISLSVFLLYSSNSSLLI